MKTAESVTPKHPDKICDQISDCLLDYFLANDPDSRVAIEAIGKGNEINIVGEVTSTKELNTKEIRDALVKSELIQDGQVVRINISEQSTDIAKGVDTGGAGDQGIMLGYATNETPDMVPLEHDLARSLCYFLYLKFPYDGKTQVTLNDDNSINCVVASFQNVSRPILRAAVGQWFETMKLPVAKKYINPAGDWNIGGFEADSGLTGRKPVVDNYGPAIPIGGGAFSGKDPTKVDRSAAYMARKIAVDYLTKAGADKVYVQLAYAIGVAEPVHAQATIILGDTKYTEEITGYDLTPKGIIEFLDLKRPQYLELAKWGHFGRGFEWDIRP